MRGERPYCERSARERAFLETRGIAIAVASQSEVPGMEFHDIVSEMLVYLWREALPRWQVGGSPLPVFVKCVLKLRVTYLLRREYRLKRLTRITHTGVDAGVWDSLLDVERSVEEAVVSRVYAAEIAPAIRQRLSPLERQALEAVAAGCDMHEAAAAIGVSYKSVDNVLHRARLKFKEMEL